MGSLREVRTLLSLVAASVGVLICVYQQHFTVEFAHPASFELVFQHRCGLVMVGAMAWAAVEVVNLGWREIRGPKATASDSAR